MSDIDEEIYTRKISTGNGLSLSQSIFLLGMMKVWKKTGNDDYLGYIKGYYDALINDQGNLLYERDQLDTIQVGILLFKL